ncbi:MAG TPA: C4-type zinc ribbon domain-containing protein [Mycobacteriales bacterium]|nr:C4-type zinc ribbon domain-containing protein [Mycobacteriales bacterium]
MKAPPAAQLRLLDLQELDTALDRLAHRRRTLPELAAIEAAEARLTELRDAVIGAETELSDADREQRKVENDVDLVRTRMTRDQQRLDSGNVSSAKELENLQHELGTLAKRQADLEEVVLEHMERREEIESRLTALQAERARVTADLEGAGARRDAAFAEIDAEAAARSTERSSVAAELPADLLALYEKVRASSGGQGAAALHRGQCQGCHLSLPPNDLAAFRAAPEDEVLRCEECRRILVRRPDSGL